MLLNCHPYNLRLGQMKWNIFHRSFSLPPWSVKQPRCSGTISSVCGWFWPFWALHPVCPWVVWPSPSSTGIPATRRGGSKVTPNSQSRSTSAPRCFSPSSVSPCRPCCLLSHCTWQLRAKAKLSVAGAAGPSGGTWVALVPCCWASISLSGLITTWATRCQQCGSSTRAITSSTILRHFRSSPTKPWIS